MSAPTINFTKADTLLSLKKDKKTKRIWLRFPVTKGFQLFIDICLLIEAFIFAYLLRFDFALSGNDLLNGLMQLPFIVLVQLLALRVTGIYKFIWRYVGMAEIQSFLKAVAWSILPILTARLLLPDTVARFRVPLSVILIDTVLAFGLILGVRVLRRALYEGYERRQTTARSTEALRLSVLLIGAGRAGVMTAREILNRGDLNLDIKGFVDDDVNKQGAVIQGVSVLGKIENFPQLVNEHKISLAVICLAHVTRPQMRRILDICEETKVKVKIIPGLYEILQGRVNVSRLRDVQVEDLLARLRFCYRMAYDLFLKALLFLCPYGICRLTPVNSILTLRLD